MKGRPNSDVDRPLVAVGDCVPKLTYVPIVPMNGEQRHIHRGTFNSPISAPEAL
jgi:hypothetical protein